jgi:sensor histidine kinase regulating citrate/malate metabolism
MNINIRNIFRKLSLVQKFSVAVIFLIFIAMLIINSLVITRQRTALKAEMDNSQLIVVRNLARDAVEPLIFMDPLRLDELVRIIAQTPGCLYAAITDNNRRIVAHTDRRLLGSYLTDEIRQYSYLAIDSGSEHIHDIRGRDNKEIMVPIKTGQQSLGMLIVGFSKKNVEYVIENNLRELKNYIFLISGIVMLVGVWGAFGLAKLLTTPMKRLKDRMELVQKGDLDAEVPNNFVVNCWEMLDCSEKECPAYGKKRCWTVSGTRCFGGFQGDMFQKICDCKNCIVYKESCGDEVGELIEVFNHMIKRLRDSIKKLEETGIEKARLEKLSALGEMSMTVAHEIKNPLNAIKGSVLYLKENFRGEVLQEFLSIIEEETERLNDIVTSFLRFSRPAPLKLEDSDINATVRDTVELIRQDATENNVEVVISLDERAPLIKADSGQLKQALLNILVNSLDATKAGDTIKITTGIFDSRVAIMIKDTGAGISKEIISDIFKPFFTTKTRGSGLGLACVERIVKDHKGDISVKSETGSGTEFTITLPVRN